MTGILNALDTTTIQADVDQVLVCHHLKKLYVAAGQIARACKSLCPFQCSTDTRTTNMRSLFPLNSEAFWPHHWYRSIKILRTEVTLSQPMNSTNVLTFSLLKTGITHLCNRMGPQI